LAEVVSINLNWKIVVSGTGALISRGRSLERKKIWSTSASPLKRSMMKMPRRRLRTSRRMAGRPSSGLAIIASIMAYMLISTTSGRMIKPM